MSSHSFLSKENTLSQRGPATVNASSLTRKILGSKKIAASTTSNTTSGSATATAFSLKGSSGATHSSNKLNSLNSSKSNALGLSGTIGKLTTLHPNKLVSGTNVRLSEKENASVSASGLPLRVIKKPTATSRTVTQSSGYGLSSLKAAQAKKAAAPLEPATLPSRTTRSHAITSTSSSKSSTSTATTILSHSHVSSGVSLDAQALRIQSTTSAAPSTISSSASLPFTSTLSPQEDDSPPSGTASISSSTFSSTKSSTSRSAILTASNRNLPRKRSVSERDEYFLESYSITDAIPKVHPDVIHEEESIDDNEEADQKPVKELMQHGEKLQKEKQKQKQQARTDDDQERPSKLHTKARLSATYRRLDQPLLPVDDEKENRLGVVARHDASRPLSSITSAVSTVSSLAASATTTLPSSSSKALVHATNHATATATAAAVTASKDTSAAALKITLESARSKRIRYQEDVHVAEIDADDLEDVVLCAEYVQEILEYLTQREKVFMPNPNYIQLHPELSWHMRGVLVDWLIEVHQKLRFHAETLFLAINIMDRFLSKRTVSSSKFQLVGLTCLFLAAKVEEILCPPVSTFSYMTDSAYTEDDLLKAEQYILRVLNFEIWAPGPLSFLRRISKVDNYNLLHRNLAKFLSEATLLDHRFLVYPPSMVAAASMFLARQLHSAPGPRWPVSFRQVSGYDESQLLPCVQHTVLTLQVPMDEGSYFYGKYCGRKFKSMLEEVKAWGIKAFGEEALRVAAAAYAAELESSSSSSSS